MRHSILLYWIFKGFQENSHKFVVNCNLVLFFFQHSLLSCPFQELHLVGVGGAGAQVSDGALPAARRPALEVAFQLPTYVRRGAGLGHPNEQRGRRAGRRGHGFGHGAAVAAPDVAGPGLRQGCVPPRLPGLQSFSFAFPKVPPRSRQSRSPSSPRSLLLDSSPGEWVASASPARWATVARGSPLPRAWARAWAGARAGSGRQGQAPHVRMRPGRG